MMIYNRCVLDGCNQRFHLLFEKSLAALFQIEEDVSLAIVDCLIDLMARK